MGEQAGQGAPGWQPEPVAQEQPRWQEVAPGVLAVDGAAHWDWWAEAVGPGSGASGSGLPGPAAGPRVAQPGPRPRLRPAVLGLAGLAVLGVVLVLGVGRGGAGTMAGSVPVTAEPLPAASAVGDADGGSPTPGHAGAPAAPPLDRDTTAMERPGPEGAGTPDWWAVLAELDARRSAALAATDPALLGAALAPGSPAWAADAATIEGLVAAGVAPVGLSTAVVALEDVAPLGSESLAVESPVEEALPEASASAPADAPSPQAVASIGPDAAAVALRVVDRRSGYTLVDPAGQVVHEVPAADERRWRVTLVRVPDARGADEGDDPGWRVHRVEPVP
jgi:hypothetical protein